MNLSGSRVKVRETPVKTDIRSMSKSVEWKGVFVDPTGGESIVPRYRTLWEQSINLPLDKNEGDGDSQKHSQTRPLTLYVMYKTYF